MIETATAPPVSLRRPRLVWVIFLFYAIVGGFSLILQLERLLGLAKFGPISTSAELFHISVGAMNIVAATSLWLLRRVALPLFSLCLLLNLSWVAWDWLPGGENSRVFAKDAIVGGVMVFGSCIGLLLSLGMWWYAFQLWRRGVLR